MQKDQTLRANTSPLLIIICLTSEIPKEKIKENGLVD